MRNIFALVAVAAVAFGFAPNVETITVKGSDTMVILAQRWAELYMNKNRNVKIQVTGGGSGTGISALINGTTDICNASRPMKASEKAKLKERFSTSGVEIKVAKDGMAVYLNERSPVKALTLEQIRQIYTAKITNWKEVGGPNAKIILYGRESNAGTYVYFKDHVLQGADFAPNTQTMPGTAAVVNAVAKDRNGIGYGGAAYGKGIRFVKVKKDAGSPGYEPTPGNVRSGDYPISRFLYMYTRHRPTGAMKQFIDWILSSKGQAVVSEVGYFPVR